ncbi:MAG: phospholipase D-like domain-containing protein, partial [Candidatus Thorarchaeota archaeon]
LFHANNIPIVWQDTRWFTANHNKGIIVDGRIVLISSINYSDNSIEDNREAGVIIENEEIAQWYLEVFDYDWSIADFDHINNVNLDWNPNIPTSSSSIDVIVYGHELFGDGITSVSLGVKIGSGAWNNYSITGTAFASAEGDLENFIHTIPAQADGTDIIVQASIEAGGVLYVGEEMVIHVRDSLGSASTPPPIDPMITELLPYILMAIVVAIGAFCYKKRK